MAGSRPPVVILGAGSNITALAAARCFTGTNVPVIAVDTDGYGALLGRSKAIREVIFSGDLPHAPERFLARLEQIGRTLYRTYGSRALLLPMHDTALSVCAKNISLLDRYFLLSGNPTGKDVLRFFDKARFYASLPEELAYAPWTRRFVDREELRRAAADLPFPVVLKPACKDPGLRFERYFGAKALEARGLAGLLQRAEAYFPRGGLVVQECLDYCEGREVSWAGYRSLEGVCTGMTARELHKYPALGGTATLVRSETLPEIETLAREILNSVGLHGVCELSFLPSRTTGRYKVVECNPRCWLQLGLMRRCGLNAPLQAYQEHTGIDCGVGGETAREGVSWISPEYDLLRCLFTGGAEPLFARLRGWCRDVGRADEVALWDSDEPTVALAHLVLYARRAGRAVRRKRGSR